MSQRAWASRPWFWAAGAAVVGVLVFVAVRDSHQQQFASDSSESSSSSSSSSGQPSGPDWCLYVGKAAGQWDNIGQGAQQQTATVTDEAHYFDQLAGDLDMVAVLGGGQWGATAARGEVGAKQARVQLLMGGNPGPGAAKVRDALSSLSQICP